MKLNSKISWYGIEREHLASGFQGSIRRGLGLWFTVKRDAWASEDPALDDLYENKGTEVEGTLTGPDGEPAPRLRPFRSRGTYCLPPGRPEWLSLQYTAILFPWEVGTPFAVAELAVWAVYPGVGGISEEKEIT